MEKLQKLVVYLIIFVTPLLGFTNLGYEQTKVVFFVGVLSLGYLLWFVNWVVRRPKINLHFSLINIVSFLFILVLLLTAYTGVNFPNSVVGGYPYLQGWFLYLGLFLFSVYILLVKINLKDMSYLIATAASLVSLKAFFDFVLLNFFHQNVLSYAGRVVSTFGQPDFYSGFLVLTLPFQIGLKNKKRKFLKIAGLILTLIGIVISGSKIAIFLMIVYFFCNFGKKVFPGQEKVDLLCKLFNNHLFGDLICQPPIRTCLVRA